MKFVIYNVENCRTRENRVGKKKHKVQQRYRQHVSIHQIGKRNEYHNERPTGVWL